MNTFERVKEALKDNTWFEWEPGRIWKEFGGERYSEEFEECDIFENKIYLLKDNLIWS